ncbi:CbtB-domain containing protein [Tepidiforma flava]|uniref:CbtB-domain containing protein n=1 Tax=Tepidiforma flava TaxID=3004094 RepID=A0ABY7M7D3_9CHLR|nr:CbtB-domain containing protein [Tepidiforma flava]WBL36315.1 CbtB-domain containing protein [Tepidiforma flava]
MSVSSSAAAGRAQGRAARLPGRSVVAAGSALALAVVLLYLAGFEQGAVALFDGTTVHEFVHDARHALGFPCH